MNKNYNYNNPEDIAEALAAAKNKRKEKQINEKLVEKINKFILFDTKEYEKINKFKLSGVRVDYVYSDTCVFEIINNQIFIYNDINKKDKKITINMDDTEGTLIFCKSGYLNPDVVYLLNKLIDLGFTVMNDPKAVQVSANKYLTAKLLDEHNLLQPKYCLVTKDDCSTDAPEGHFDEIISSIYGNNNEENEYICKLLDGHGGHGVFKCNGKNILSIIQALFAIGGKKLNKILVQEKLDIRDGDFRVYILNFNGKQEVVDCIQRLKGNGDFRTNISLGNSIKKHHLTTEQESFVKRAAKFSGLMFAGVDVCINDKDNEMYIIEINGAPGAPTNIGIDQEENQKSHEEFYTNIINKVNSLLVV